MAYWTLPRLKARIRLLTGKKTEGHLTTTELLARINNYYQNVLPGDLNPDALRGFWTVYTAAPAPGDPGVNLFPLPDNVISLEKPFMIGKVVPDGGIPEDWAWDEEGTGNYLIVFLEPYNFFARWPETQTYANDQPTDVLYYGRQLLLEPPPDGAYRIKCPAFLKPTALAQETDTLLRDEWGEYLAVGTAIDILTDDQDSDAITTLSPMLSNARGKAAWPEAAQMSMAGMRPEPRW